MLYLKHISGILVDNNTHNFSVLRIVFIVGMNIRIRHD